LSVEKTQRPAALPPVGRCQHAFRFRRVRKLDDQASALEEIWLDGRFTQSIDQSLITDSLYSFYHAHLGLRITRAEDRVSVATLPVWAPHVLSNSGVSHWGFIERLSRDQDGVIAEYSNTWFDPEKVCFVAR